MKRIPTGILSAAIAIAVAGCGLDKPPPTEVAPQKNRVQVERMLYRHLVDFAGNSSEPTAGEREALRRFLQETGADRDATVVVTATDDPLAQQRRRVILRLLRGMGFRPRPEDPLLDPRPETGGDVLVRVASYHAIPPDCPDHSRTRIGDYYNLPTSNFGCATTRNLGLMVANPRDLLRGRDLAPADAERHAWTVERYRSGVEPDEIWFKKDGSIEFEERKPWSRKE